MSSPQRVMVIGCSGAGKSTITGPLAERLGLPVVHLDHHFWRPGWNRLSDEEWELKVRELIAADRWIHDGNYRTTMPIRLPRADLVVFLDISRWRCLWRVVKRRLMREQQIPGCGDRVTWEFLRYVWNYPKRSRPGVLVQLEAHDGPVVWLRSPAEVRRFLGDSSSP